MEQAARMSTLVKVKCDICFMVIGIIDLSAIKLPLDSSMFLSPDPYHGFDPPFLPGQTWEDFRCPYGRVHRPFIKEGTFELGDGTSFDLAKPWALHPELPDDMTQRIRPLPCSPDKNDKPVEFPWHTHVLEFTRDEATQIVRQENKECPVPGCLWGKDIEIPDKDDPKYIHFSVERDGDEFNFNELDKLDFSKNDFNEPAPLAPADLNVSPAKAANICPECGKQCRPGQPMKWHMKSHQGKQKQGGA